MYSSFSVVGDSSLLSVFTAKNCTFYLNSGKNKMKITVVFNNFNLLEGLLPAWGMGAVVESETEKILFDTGSDGRILLKNMERLGIPVSEISRIIISHNHWDHTGGLAAFLYANPRVEIYAPDLDQELISLAESRGTKVYFTSGSMAVGKGISTTGVFPRPVPEQALIIKTSRGNVILTGCSHPGVVNMVLAAPEPRYFVSGGFHLFRSSLNTIKATAMELEQAGVALVAPSHCTGEAAIEYFRQYFQDRFVYGGLGAVFKF